MNSEQNELTTDTGRDAWTMGPPKVEPAKAQQAHADEPGAADRYEPMFDVETMTDVLAESLRSIHASTTMTVDEKRAAAYAVEEICLDLANIIDVTDDAEPFLLECGLVPCDGGTAKAWHGQPIEAGAA